MVDFTGVLILLMWVLSVAGYCWLVSFAFKQSRMWGLAVFFLSPIAAFVFAKKHWPLAKKPFLIYVSSSCLALGLSIFFVYSEMGIQPSKSSEPSELAQDEGSLKTLTLAKESPVYSDALENALARMPQASKSEDEQKLMRLISEYRHYKQHGFTDRSRRYIVRNITELLLLSGLDTTQRTQLTGIKNKLEAQQQKEFEPTSASPDKKTLQAARLEKQPGQTSRHSHFPPSFLKDRPELPGQRPQAGLNTPAVNKMLSAGVNQKKQEKIRWREEKPEEISRTQKISFNQAKQYIGSQITFLNLSGIEQKCFLTGVSGGALECEKRFQSGTFSARYTRSEVRALKVLRN